MSHVRASIRQQIATVLASAGTLAGSRVFSERVQAVDSTEVPFIELSVSREQQEASAFGGGGNASMLLERTLAINVHYVQAVESGYYDAGDEALRLIEGALVNASLTGIKTITPSGTLFDEERDGARQLYTVTQEYTITYYTTAGDPASPH